MSDVLADEERIFVGHYGCAGRLVKVRAVRDGAPMAVGFRMPKASWRRKCPACGITHTFKIHWRKPIRPGEEKEAEINLADRRFKDASERAKTQTFVARGRH